MKKIDFHIHTTEAHFTFDIDKLKEYIKSFDIDAIAITNHNMFDKSQFEEIINDDDINITIFPGVEVDLEKGHILVIAPVDRIDEFDIACNKLTNEIASENDSISYDKFLEIFTNYKDYLLIPHYKKNPAIKPEIIERFAENIVCGEVQNSKKWEVTKKNDRELVPVLFSDIRMANGLIDFPTRLTYLDINDITIPSLKLTLSDRSKVYVSPSAKDDEFQINKDGIIASTKLNVIMGNRSSGKTYTLEKIKESFEDSDTDSNIKYIKQFELTENCGENKFNELIQIDNNNVSDSYLLPLKGLIADVLNIDLVTDDSELKKYYESLIALARGTEKNDIYARTKLFTEVPFSAILEEESRKMFDAVSTLLGNETYGDVINEKLDKNKLLELLIFFASEYKKKYLEYKLKGVVDDMVDTVKEALGKKSSVNPVEDVDFYQLIKNKIIVKKFNDLINATKTNSLIYRKTFHNYKVVVKRRAFTNATDVKTINNFATKIKEPFNDYSNPYKYLLGLQEVGIAEDKMYKTLIAIDYEVRNKRGFKVSGGERAEFNLLKELSNSYKYDALLIDEPESSFDNPFIKSNIIGLLKELADKTTVFIVTHNNTLGTLIKPNKIIYTEHDDSTNEFNVYSGYYADKNLIGSNGKTISNYDVLMNSMEAGEGAYTERNSIYETIKNC